MSCPGCGSTHTDLLESRRCANGSRRRRYACLDCRYRWTIWIGPRPAPGRAPNARQGSYRPPLTLDKIRIALTSPLSARQLAPVLECSHATISSIRRGQVHADAWPELPRNPQLLTPSCLACLNWRGGACSWGFPDPIEVGPSHAADCDLFTQQP